MPRKRFHPFLPYATLLALFLTNFVYAGEYWHVEKGANSMKILSMPSEPRQAALAGAGIASPYNAGETMRNPLAGTATNSPSLSFSKTEFSDHIGAGRTSMLAHIALGGWHLTTGIESLNYDKIQGYTEDGLTADELTYTAGTVAVQAGIAKKFNSATAGLTARYASQNTDDYYERGFLFDGGVKYDLKKNIAFLKKIEFGAIFSNFGWLLSREKETAPLSVQTGITATCSLPLGFSGALSTDLYRRNDSAEELRTGLEIIFRDVFSLRFGYPFSGGENDALSAGFAINLGFGDIEYAYQNRAVLEANHIFGISIYF